jgi:glyoxylase-like metal-dependent hydrolase (beta-lactamase superfamily II)
VSDIRWVRADNPSSMTLDGTRTYVIGRAQVAVIDPGPLLPQHMDAVADAVGSGVCVSVLLTHRHPDHAENAEAMARRLHTQVAQPQDGVEIMTDGGLLHAVATPGHTSDHVAFWHEASRSMFCGDLMMGGMDTALVAPPEGDLQEYLDSLEKVRALRPAVIYPAHGEPIHDSDAAIDRYVQHRLQRVEQVITALRAGPQSADELVSRIYGAELEDSLRAYAASAVEAYLLFLEHGGRVNLRAGQWSLA